MGDHSGAEPEKPVFSAVVFGYRNQATVLRAVRSLMEQDGDDPFEVIVATSGGDRTGDLVREAFPTVKVAESPTRLLPGGVRNLGARLATGDMVGFLEADCVACPGWMRNRIELHRAGHEAVATALDVMPGDGLIAQAALYLVHPARLAGHRRGPATEYQAYGLSFDRRLLERAGPFDETLRSYEDTAMAERLHVLGVEPWFDPTVCIAHDFPSKLSELVRDQFARGRRDSWAELLRLPSGRHRHRLEVAPASRIAVVALRALYRLCRRIRSTAGAVRSGRTGPGRELPSLILPMLAGQVAYQAGWALDQLRGARTGPDAAARDILPAPTGLRRWVTTGGERVVTLTFDGLATAPHRDKLLATLGSSGVEAAFFVTGALAEARPADVQAVAAGRHLVGSSGWSGDPFPSLSDDELDRELDRTVRTVRDLTARQIGHVRPPRGEYDWRVVSLLERRDLVPWLWTTHPAPGLPPGSDAEAVLRTTMDGLTPGAVIALPLGGGEQDAGVVGAVPGIIEEARRRGYRFVPLTYLPSDQLPAGGDAPPVRGGQSTTGGRSSRSGPPRSGTGHSRSGGGGAD